MSKSSFVHGKGHNWAQGTVADTKVIGWCFHID